MVKYVQILDEILLRCFGITQWEIEGWDLSFSCACAYAWMRVHKGEKKQKFVCFGQLMHQCVLWHRSSPIKRLDNWGATKRYQISRCTRFWSHTCSDINSPDLKNGNWFIVQFKAVAESEWNGTKTFQGFSG